jgi:hypothetical protein
MMMMIYRGSTLNPKIIMNQQIQIPGLIAHFEIAQGTDQWHTIRYAKVGGVVCKSLLGKPETLINHIGACHLEPYTPEPPSYVSDDMQRGIDLEPMARAEMAKYISAKHGRPIDLLTCGWLQNTTIPVIGISPDGITADLTIQIETKCPGKSKHAATLYGGIIPDDNIDQCLHAFTVNPVLEYFYFGSFRPECDYPLFVRELTKDSMVDMGTKVRPNVKKVSEWVQILQAAAITLQENIKISNDNLKKI